MNWDDQVKQFQPLNRENLGDQASGRDLEQAVSLYNKALVHVSHGSTDIALISLRKILSRNPWFGQAAFLAACLLARERKNEEAAVLLQQAISSGTMTDEEKVRAQDCLQEIYQVEAEDDSISQGTGDQMRSQITDVNAAAILEKIKKGRRVKVASDRERQEVMRQAESGQKQETRIEQKKQPADYVRLALPVLAAILLVVLLIFAGFRWIPNAVRNRAEQKQAAAKLEWLLTELQMRAGNNHQLAELLSEFEEKYSPAETTVESEPELTTGSITETTAKQTTQSQTETTETAATTTTLQPTPEETLQPSALLLLEAADLYEQALDIYETDLMAASEYLLQSRAILQELAPETSAPDLEATVADMSDSVETFISEIARSAAERFRVAGMDLFNSQEYETALPYFLTAYELRPDAYGGGVAYYCGRCYQLLDEPEQARPYFEYVADNFAGRDIAASAAVRLREMGY